MTVIEVIVSFSCRANPTRRPFPITPLRLHPVLCSPCTRFSLPLPPFHAAVSRAGRTRKGAPAVGADELFTSAGSHRGKIRHGGGQPRVLRDGSSEGVK